MAERIEFHLPESLTIANVNSLHEEFEALVNQPDCDKVVLQGRDVHRTDTAGVQLLLAFVFASRERQISIDWDQPSQKLINAASLLGLDTELGIH